MIVLIAGGGIAGLTLALMLHDAGIKARVFEKARSARELGLGINLLPHAVAELDRLGLSSQLEQIGVRTRQLVYKTAVGQDILIQPRGLWAGLSHPQYSIHRGKLHMMLLDAVRSRLGPENVLTDRELVGLDQDSRAISAEFMTHEGAHFLEKGDILIGADGIHSRVRTHFFPDQGHPFWNGVMMWRGAAWARPFEGGDTMLIAGGMDRKLVIYPIAYDPARPSEVLINWVVNVKVAEAGAPPPERNDWSRRATVEKVLRHFENRLSVPEIDIKYLVEAAPAIFEYPMCDRDGLPLWSHGRVTLIGDAAHPMYPVGSNGASQAILDARCLTDKLVQTSDAVAALSMYDAVRRPITSEIVRMNRAGGPERVIDLVQARATRGFRDVHDLVSEEELQQIVGSYQKVSVSHQ
ncbi:flavin-dependent oxidoreductase [Paradonghicola geojensis]|nr:flavin-dependent oxidoreductase [Marivivens geojensis]